jgi:hypothetical protein
MLRASSRSYKLAGPTLSSIPKAKKRLFNGLTEPDNKTED